jgi:hypothetical protein
MMSSNESTFANNSFEHGPPTGLVNKLVIFVFLSSFTILAVPTATAYCRRWYVIALCFFVNLDSGLVQLVMTP